MNRTVKYLNVISMDEEIEQTRLGLLELNYLRVENKIGLSNGEIGLID